jgi:hypothetical protein
MPDNSRTKNCNLRSVELANDCETDLESDEVDTKNKKNFRELLEMKLTETTGR